MPFLESLGAGYARSLLTWLLKWIAPPFVVCVWRCKLIWQLYSINLIRFNRDRSDYKGRKYEGIAKYIGSAKRRVTIVSINLVTGQDYEGLQSTIQTLVTSSPPVPVTVSLLNPDNEFAMTAISLTLNKDKADLAKAIRTTLHSLCRLRKEKLSNSHREHLTVKVHDTIPFASAIIIDSDETWGQIQFETKGYKLPIQKSFGFTLKHGGSHSLYKDMVTSYSNLIADGKDISNESPPD